MGQFNIGGGLLAAAGALGGLGQGLTAVGQEQQKENLAVKMDKLAQAREEAIVRLQGGQQKDLETQKEGFEAGQTDKSLAAGARMKQAEIEHQDTRQDKQIAAAEAARKDTEAHEERVHASDRASNLEGRKYSADKRLEGIKYQSDQRKDTAKSSNSKFQAWKPTDIPTNIKGPGGTTSPGKVPGIFDPNTGTRYGIYGDRLIAHNGAEGPMYDPGSFRRGVDLRDPPVRDVVTDPLGIVPTGPLQGLTKMQAFENNYHYLPKAVTMKLTQQERQGPQQPAAAPSSQPAADNEPDNGEANDDAAASAPTPGSNAMGSYNNVMGQ